VIPATKTYNLTIVAHQVHYKIMNENVITIEECRKRAQQGGFDVIHNLETSALRLVSEGDLREVSVEPVECKWNKQPRPPKSKSMVYILVCLPLVLSVVYMILTYGLRLW
jgi:hypothetical protein